MNGNAHLIGGALSGPVTGAVLAKRSNRQPTLPEIGGWLLGGIAGAKTPDLLEPAYCPRHREVCHSVSVLALDVALLQSRPLENWIQSFHRKAADYRRRSQLEPGNAFLFSLLALLFELLAGLLPGFLGGYASHLILDSTTPCGLPVL